MRALVPQYWEERRSVRPASVWVTGPDQHYLAIRADVEVEDRGTINPYITAYFSYVGLVMDQSLDRDLPLWFTRGFTGVLSNTIVRDDHVLIGAPIPWQLQILRERPLFLLPKLLTITRKSREATEGDPRQVFDAETFDDEGPEVNDSVTSIAEHVREGDVEAGEEWRGEHVASLAGQFDGSSEPIGVAPVDADHVNLGIDDPVFNDGRVLVQAALDRFVALSSAWRPNLYDQVWRSHDVLVREKLGRALVRDVQQVRLDDVKHREAYVQRGVEHSAVRMRFQPRTDQQIQPAGNLLVPDIGRRRHVVLPVDQLMPLSVVWKQQEVVVGELHAWVGRSHVVAPGHALIVDPGGARGAPEDDRQILA